MSDHHVAPICGIILMLVIFLNLGIYWAIYECRDNPKCILNNTHFNISEAKALPGFMENIILDKFKVDVTDLRFIRQGKGKSTFFTAVFKSKQHISVPKNWCYPHVPKNGKIDYHRPQDVPPQLLENDILKSCFPQVEIPDAAMELIRRTLRRIRNEFRKARIPIFMAFGTALGSMRYHKIMPFDCDYDFTIFEEDQVSALRLFKTISDDPKIKMRVLDCPFANAKIGLACNTTQINGTSPFPSKFGEHPDEIPVATSWADVRDYLLPCAIYIDLYPTKRKWAGLRTYSTNIRLPPAAWQSRAPQLRPIDGTLFHIFNGYPEYLTKVYRRDLKVCVPKDVSHFKNVTSPKWCWKVKFTCSRLHRRYPIVYKIIDSNSPATYEIGVDAQQSGECLMRSLFYHS